MIGIILGFQYGDEKKLDSTLIDIFHIYNWMKKAGYEIYIFSDCKYNERNISLIKSSINYKICSEDFLKFDFDKIKYVVNGETLFTNIYESLKDKKIEKKVTIYYTGHGENGSILLPNYKYVPFWRIREYIYNFFSPDCEFFWILDCCYPDSMGLPYKLDKNNFIFRGLKSKFITNPTLIMTSSENKEQSAATSMGSLFTRFLYKDLMNMTGEIDDVIKNKYNRNLRRISSRIITEIRKIHVEYSQTVSFYSNYIVDPLLWFWITGGEDIFFDYNSISFVKRI